MCGFSWSNTVFSPNPAGTVRILLQGGAGIYRRLLRLRQLQVKKKKIHVPKQTTEELPSLIFCNILFVNIPPKKICVYILTVLEVGTISFILAGDFICSKVLVQILLAPFFPMFYWGIK